MQILITTKFNKGDRVRFNLDQDDSDTGTVTEVVVTRDDATESVKVDYKVAFDRDRNPSASGMAFDAFVLDRM